MEERGIGFRKSDVLIVLEEDRNDMRLQTFNPSDQQIPQPKGYRKNGPDIDAVIDTVIFKKEQIGLGWPTWHIFC